VLFCEAMNWQNGVSNFPGTWWGVGRNFKETKLKYSFYLIHW
jgi:hypothetical protein